MKTGKFLMAALAVVIVSTSCMIRFDSKKMEESITSEAGSPRKIKASGVYVSKDTVVADFSAIRLSGAVDVDLVQRPGPCEVRIHASDNTVQYIKVRSDNGVLSIKTEFPANARIVGDWDRKITVSAPDVSSLEVSGACEFECSALAVADNKFIVNCSGASDIEMKNLSATSVEINLSGASNFEADRVATGDVRIKVSGSSNVEFDDISAGNVYAKLSGASELSLSGKADSADYDISGSSDVDAEELNCPATMVKASGASSVKYRDAAGKLKRK